MEERYLQFGIWKKSLLMCHLLVGVDFYFSTIVFIVLIIIIWNCTFFGYFSPEMNAVLTKFMLTSVVIL